LFFVPFLVWCTFFHEDGVLFCFVLVLFNWFYKPRFVARFVSLALFFVSFLVWCTFFHKDGVSFFHEDGFCSIIVL